MKKILLMFTLVGLVMLGCNYSYAENGITYDNSLTTRTDLNGNSFKYGTITIEHDGESITMMDRNLGATTNDITKTGSYGYHYQWGNNYGFNPFDESVETNATGETADTSGYGPGNYYSNSTFRAIRERPYNWSSSSNDNLRGGTGDSSENNWGLDSTNSITDRQGPCPNGYHVPSAGEFNKVLKYRAEENGLNLEDGRDGLKYSYDGRKFQTDFKIPFAGFRDGDEALVYATGYSAIIWSSSPDVDVSDDYDFAHSFTLNEFYTVSADYDPTSRANAFSVRCFKNPDNSTVNENLPSSVGNSNSHNFEYDYSKLNPNYSNEMNQAYQYAYHYGITTINNISNANMNGGLTRIAMAKMLSNYAINILGLTPDTTKNCHFSDVSNSLDAQYDNGVREACQLGLMGVGINQFHPNTKVTRAEFGTVLSRALNAKNSTKLTQMNNAEPYYYEHLRYLKREGIMNNISNPGSLELRGYVMLMLMRADKNYVPEEIVYANTHTYSVNKIDTTALNVATAGCNWLTRTQNQYGYDIDMPNKNWANDIKFVNKALQDVRDNGEHLVKNYIDEANRVLDSAGLTKRDQCKYSLLIDELENQKGYLKSYKTENGKIIIGIDFVSYKENVSGDDFLGVSWELMKNTSTKLRYYTLNDNVELELLNVNENGYTNEDGYYNHDRKYVSNWNKWINAFCNNEPVYNWTQEEYNRNEFGRLCTKNMIGNDEYNDTLINFRFDATGTIDRISGLNYWLSNAS